jgi:hypothetical protein
LAFINDEDYVCILEIVAIDRSVTCTLGTANENIKALNLSPQWPGQE